MNDWLFKILRCPITGQSLEAAGPELVQQLRELSRTGQLISHKGIELAPEFEGGLVNQSRGYFYRVQDGIPSLLPDEAVRLADVSLR